MQRFEGIDAKLGRAYEHLFNLDREIAAFFEHGEYPVLPEDDSKLLLKAIEYHRNRSVPPRFGMLAGELIHHLRSCFDHIVWHFSVGATDKHTWIAFPVCREKPINANDRRSYKGKIERIDNPNAAALIERLQPYNAPNPIDDPLLIIHNFDIRDKHRELVLCVGTAARFFDAATSAAVEAYESAHPEAQPLEVAGHFKQHGALRPYISFRNFGKRELEPVIPGLMNLFNYTVKVVKAFGEL